MLLIFPPCDINSQDPVDIRYLVDAQSVGGQAVAYMLDTQSMRQSLTTSLGLTKEDWTTVVSSGFCRPSALPDSTLGHCPHNGFPTAEK